MRWQTTAVLAAILIALGAFYYVYEVRLGPEREKTEGRKGRVFALEPADVAEVEIKRTDATVKLKREGDGWQILAPVNARGDRGPIDETVTSIVTARMDREIEADPKSLGDFGLDRPAAEVTLRLKDGKQVGLVLGAKSPTGVWVYAREAGKPAVFVVGDSVLRDSTRPVAEFRETTVMLIPDETWTAVPKNAAVLRDKSVVGFDRDKVTRIEIESPKGTVTLAKDGERWKITAPQALAADQVEAGAVLFKLRDLRAQAFLTDDASGIPRYLAKPTVRVNITEQGASAPRIVLLAPSTEKRGGTASAYAAVAGQGPVVLVDGRALDELGRSLDDLRDRTLLPGLEPRDIKRMRVRAGAQTVVVERSGESDWKLVEGGRGSAKAATVDNLLYALRARKWKTTAAPTGDEPAKYGIDAPTLEVTLLKADGSEAGGLLVGKREGEQAWVKVKASPAIYAVDAKQLGEAPKVPDDFKG